MNEESIVESSGGGIIRTTSFTSTSTNTTSDDFIQIHSMHKDNNNNNEKRVWQIIVDWCVIVIVGLIFLGVHYGVSPTIAYFTCTDTDIWYPIKSDTVPSWVVAFVGILLPILAILVVELLNNNDDRKGINQQQRKRKMMKINWRHFVICCGHASTLFFLGLVITLTLTEIGKRWVGRLRPHFMSVCLPDVSTLDCARSGATGQVYNLLSTENSICSGTGTAKEIEEARLSFPSGHASVSAYSMLFLIIFLEARLDAGLRFRFVKPLLQLVAFMLAYGTSLSRVPDFKHRGSDVLGGSVLGIGTALYIGLVTGRVMWNYQAPSRRSHYDFDNMVMMMKKDETKLN